MSEPMSSQPMREGGVEAAAPGPRVAPRSFLERLVGVLRLDGAAYQEIAADPGALGQAAGVVAAAAIARSLSAPGGPFSGLGIAWAIQVAAFWPITAGLIWAFGRWFGRAASFARVARVAGFAMAPLLLTVARLVPLDLVVVAVGMLSTALLIATFLFGVRHALQTSLGGAAFVLLVAGLSLVFLFMVFQYLTMQPA